MGSTILWKDIKGFENYYCVSKAGEINRKRDGLSPTKVTPSLSKAGYLKVNLCVHCKKTTKYIHHLVYETFVGKCPKGKVITFKDGNKQNVSLRNLLVRPRRTVVLEALDRIAAKLSFKDAKKIRSLFKQGKRAMDLAEQYGVHVDHIYNVLNNRCWGKKNG